MAIKMRKILLKNYHLYETFVINHLYRLLLNTINIIDFILFYSKQLLSFFFINKLFIF